MKSKRIFIVTDALTTGEIECRMATVTPKGEAIMGSGINKIKLTASQFGLSWAEALAKAKAAKESRVADLVGELHNLQSLEFQRVGG